MQLKGAFASGSSKSVMAFQAPTLIPCTILLHIIILSFMNPSPSATVAIFQNQTDKLALAAFKEGIREDPQHALASWNESLHFCQWRGVLCGRREGQRVVRALNLTELSLVGTLSPHVGNLTYLVKLNLSNNLLHGKIPQELGHLLHLQVLSLGNNSFEGEFPTNLTQCSQLKVIDIERNQLVGDLLAEVGFLSKLNEMNLGTNNLTGCIPASLGNLSSLVSLSLSSNSLVGSIPSDLGRLPRLEQLDLGVNQLHGIIPPQLFNLSSINNFRVTENKLHGRIPSDLGLSLSKLRRLRLGGNKFSGSIPVSLSNASRLENVDMTENQLSGSVPMDLGSLRSLRILQFARNQLGSKEGNDWNFLNSLTNCSSLEIVSVGVNRLNGVLPTTIANLSTNLTMLYLADNQMSGSIPVGIENLVNLIILEIWGNNLSGSIPSGIGKLHKLNYLYMYTNQLSGQIPSSLSNITRLSVLSLFENYLEGSIPPSLGKCQFLQSLDLSFNDLNGPIPLEVFSIPSLTFLLNIGYNHLTGTLPLDYTKLKNLEVLDVSNNRLSGKIPSALGSCEALAQLYLQNNMFEGTIPPSFDALKIIEVMDLSKNNFSGKIPEYLEKFRYLIYLNLSFNNFEGEVPKKGVFQNQSGIFVVGNSRLCGGDRSLHLPICPKQDTEARRRSHAIRKIVIISCTTLCFILLLILSIILFWRRNLQKKSLNESPKDDPWLQVSYADLYKATDGFSPVNLIGVGSFGSVYKGVLEGDGAVVAVKVLDLDQLGAYRSFIAECKALRSIRHRNLIKVVTACSSIDFRGNDFKALVFDYMPNGSLENWLHPSEREPLPLRNLNLIQRLNIAIDVASALDYLHHQCDTPIVHKDIKPSNVLLDGNMTAHVGDFGLAKFLPQDSNNCSASSSVIKGTVGYIAPEQGVNNEASTNADVYSYGILLLEMLTGKRPTDDGFKGNLSIHKFAKMALPDRVMEIADPRLVEEEEQAMNDNQNGECARGRMQECLVSLIQIAVSCSAEAPQDRMLMTDVVTKLVTSRKSYLGLNTH